MNEREKMLAGKIYDPFTEGLPEERTRAHVLCRMYNETTEVDSEKRKEILAELMPDRADGVYLQGPIYFDFGKNIKMGRNSYANFNFTALDICEITIGDNVFIGPNVSLLTPLHPLCWQDRNPYFNEKTGNVTDREYGAPITIGDNCWIAGNVTVCAGVTIGEGAVVAAGAVVTKDVEPWTVVGGNPAKVIKKRELL